MKFIECSTFPLFYITWWHLIHPNCLSFQICFSVSGENRDFFCLALVVVSDDNFEVPMSRSHFV